MTLVQWQPSRRFGFPAELDRFFDDFWRSGTKDNGARSYQPVTDVAETDNEVTVVAELPGLKRGDIRVEFENGLLTVEAEKKEEVQDSGKRIHRAERVHGKFKRMLRLPSDVETDRITAKFEDGVLTVVVPKAEVAKPKAIEIA